MLRRHVLTPTNVMILLGIWAVSAIAGAQVPDVVNDTNAVALPSSQSSPQSTPQNIPQVVSIEQVAPVEPPQAPQEMRSVPSAPDQIWVNGYWYWTGAQYKWVPGYWTAQRVGFQFVQPCWTANGPHVWVFSPGGWVSIPPPSPMVIAPQGPAWPYGGPVPGYPPYAVYPRYGGYYSGYYSGYRPYRPLYYPRPYHYGPHPEHYYGQPNYGGMHDGYRGGGGGYGGGHGGYGGGGHGGHGGGGAPVRIR